MTISAETALAFLSVIASIFVTWGTVRQQIKQLEDKVGKFNNFSERMAVVEESTRSAHHRIDTLEECRNFERK